MSNIKYKYNERSLSFEPIVYNRKQKITRFIRRSVSVILLSAVLLTLLFPIIKKYSNYSLHMDNEFLLSEYQYLEKKVNETNKELEILRMRDDSLYSGIFGVDPINKNLIDGGTGGSDPYEHIRGHNNSDLMIDISTKVNKLQSKLRIHSSRFEMMENLSTMRSEKLSSIPAIQPIFNEDLIRTSSGFGMRIHPIYKIKKLHTGIDFVASEGTEVFSTGDGVVQSVLNHKQGYGKHILIKHKYGYSSLYAHLSKFNVRRGQKIKRGDIIGYVGNTGSSTNNHLHYEVIKEGRKVNPTNYFFDDLTTKQYLEMVEISTGVSTSMD